MSISVLKRKVSLLNKKKAFENRVMSSLEMRGGNLMEGIKGNRFEIGRMSRSFVRNLLVDLSERSKIFYNKYLRPTVSYDHLESQRIRENSVEKVIWDSIRNQ